MFVNYCGSYSFDFIFAYNKIIDFTIVLIAKVAQINMCRISRNEFLRVGFNSGNVAVVTS